MSQRNNKLLKEAGDGIVQSKGAKVGPTEKKVIFKDILTGGTNKENMPFTEKKLNQEAVPLKQSTKPRIEGVI